MAKKSKFRRRVAKWHRRVGILSALFVILLSITGILLNHTTAFSLDKYFVSSSWLLDLYSVDRPSVRSFSMGERWLSESGSRIYIDEDYLAVCEGSLVAGLAFEAYWLAVCHAEILLFSLDYELIERIGRSQGLPTPIQRSGKCQQVACLKSKGENYMIDVDALEWQRTDMSDAISVDWRTPAIAPSEIIASIEVQARAHIVSVEKVVLDLHAGRFLGKLGPLIMDAVAILFLLFAGSGIYMWAMKESRHKNV